MPWSQPDVLRGGVPRSGATRKWYAGQSPWSLWFEASKADLQSAVWYTSKAVQKAGGTVDEGAVGVKISGSILYNAEQCHLSPHVAADDEHGAARAKDLAQFIGAPIRAGRHPGYTEATGVIHIPAPADFDNPADHAHTLLVLLACWTRDERRLDRDDESIESVVCHLAGAMLAAAMRVAGQARYEVDWGPALMDDGRGLFEAIAAAERTVRYLLDLAHPSLRDELGAVDILVDAPRPDDAGNRVNLVTSLGQALVIDDQDLHDEDNEDIVRSEPLLLAEAAGEALNGFLHHFAHDEPGTRKNPPLCAWLAGGPGTGRNQVVAALNALFRTGGTDLTGTLVSSEDGPDLLSIIERVWSDERLSVLPCVLPSRVRVSHDRAIPTAALTALHIRYGLSPHLWVARLEHRLLRSGEYASFLAKFEERTKRPWRGDGHRNPDANIEAVIHALGGAAMGARRRVSHYQRTRQTASWQSLADEAGWMMYHMRPGQITPSAKPIENAEAGRTLFVIDLSSALNSDDPSARGWLRRALSGIPARMEDLARPAHRPLWFLMTPDIALKELTELVRWRPQIRRKQIAVDLDSSPVTAAIGGDLLLKTPEACGPIYRMYARSSSDLHALSKLDGINMPAVRDRATMLRPFPFLPCVLPIAQAVLDTFAGDPKCLPLSTLVRKALDEQYYAPPDRFVSLDVLLEPLAGLLEESSSTPAAATASARIFIGAPVAMPARRAAFPHDEVLQTMRWANRVRGLPCTPENLVRLMFARLDRPVSEMVAEVTETLADLEKRRCVRVVQTPTKYLWVRSL
jgi:antirestriction protein ArdC